MILVATCTVYCICWSWLLLASSVTLCSSVANTSVHSEPGGGVGCQYGSRGGLRGLVGKRVWPNATKLVHRSTEVKWEWSIHTLAMFHQLLDARVFCMSSNKLCGPFIYIQLHTLYESRCHNNILQVSCFICLVVGAIVILRYFTQRRPPCRRIVSSTHASPQGTDSTAICKCPPLNDPLYHVTVVDTADECEAYLVNRGLCQPLVLGLDCEWCNRPRRSDVDSLQDIPVALLQLAFPNGECLLVRLCKIRKVTPTLERLLTDKRYLRQREWVLVREVKVCDV